VQAFGCARQRVAGRILPTYLRITD